MSIQFGMWNLDGKSLDDEELEGLAAIVTHYCHTTPSRFHDGTIAMFYGAINTTQESEREAQPNVLESGLAITWDGRLDNREDLIAKLGSDTSARDTDISIAAAAYERWKTDAFRYFIGEWALSIWDPSTRTVTLAKDFIGSRYLYYSVEDGRLIWSSVLDPQLLLLKRDPELDEEYVSGWLSVFPASHLTPFRAIRAVPPCSYVRFTKHSRNLTSYWDFDSAKRIRYSCDEEYEQHFRYLFRQSVKRRLRSNSSVLAELSGGMDSSAIVCMADCIAYDEGCTPVGTLSYYDDSEPNWNERPFFTLVERRRGLLGHHINLQGKIQCQSFCNSDRPTWSPAFATDGNDAQRQLEAFLAEQQIRVVLRGIGGDEVLGGVPNPFPELADLLSQANVKSLFRQLKLWALHLRKPCFLLFRDTVQLFLPGWLPAGENKAPNWINRAFAERNQQAFSSNRSRWRFFGALPSFQENLITTATLRRQLSCFGPATHPPHEYRFPFLDRDLLEFLFAIPREQLVRPGQRRSLMRRALKSIVPGELIDRKRKAFVSRAPAKEIADALARINHDQQDLLLVSLGIVDEQRFVAELKQAQFGVQVRWVPLLRALVLEAWLRGVARWAPSLKVANETDVSSTFRAISAEKTRRKEVKTHEVRKA